MKTSFNIPQPIIDCLTRLEMAGFEAYVIGGAVRDMLLHRNVSDYDIATSALPEQTANCFLDCKTITKGIKYGTLSVHFGGYEIEITTYRIDGDYSDCRHPDKVIFASNLSDDVKRRDFTINAMAMDRHCEIVDLVGGKKDLANRTVSVIGEGVARFSEDALRVLRAFRFSVQLDFCIDEKTMNAIISTAPMLKNISPERITTEFAKILQSENPIEALSTMKKLGVLEYVLPDIVFPKCLPESTKLVVRLASIIDDINAISRLSLSNIQHKQVETLLKYKGINININKIAIKHLLKQSGIENVMLIFEFNNCKAEFMQVYNEIVENNECYTLSMLKIGGYELIEKGYTGKDIKVQLEKLLGFVIDGTCENDREKLLEKL